jgi:hypothetical protein
MATYPVPPLKRVVCRRLICTAIFHTFPWYVRRSALAFQKKKKQSHASFCSY